MSRVSGKAPSAIWLVLMLWTGLTSAVWAQVPISNAVQVSTGASHTCALTSAGGVKCWGSNSDGQLGDGSTTRRETGLDVAGLTSGVAAIAAGDSHTCALTTTGGVKCWGRNDTGPLGDGSNTQRLTAVDVSGLSTGVTAIATGGFHTCALTTSGGVKCWGNNQLGQLGDNSQTTRLTAVDVVGLSSGVAAIATGDGHSCALTTTGGVKCWGRNFEGQLGDNSTTTRRLTPVNVSGLSSGVTAIATRGNHTCALTSAGGVKCWGNNVEGQLGDNSTTRRLAPVDVSGLTSGVAAIAAGHSHTCAVTSAGGAKCWGNNLSGQLGDNSQTQRRTPVDVSGLTSGVAAVAAGGGNPGGHTCALTTTGGVKCWGLNFDGQLGDGISARRMTPVAVSGLSSGVAAIATGGAHTCALTSAAGVKCWGNNSQGQLGDGSTSQRLTAVDVSGLTSGVVAVATGASHTCALTSSGGVKCWGGNGAGQLGDNSTAMRLTAVDVSGLSTGVTAIATGANHTCAITSAGGAKCWGSNGFGQLGDNSDTNRLAAVDVSGLTSGVAAIATGGAHTCALTSAGGVKCWGSNGQGQLGDGTGWAIPRRLTAVDVSGLTSGVAAIAAGESQTLALTSAGGVKGWGRNANGELGDGGTTNRQTPVEVSGLTSGVAAIASGFFHTCALTSAGGVKCWGHNGSGQLGDTSQTRSLTPVDVSGLTSGMAAVATGDSHTCSVTSAGGAKCWGFNFDGQLGDGTRGIRSFPADAASESIFTSGFEGP